MTSRIPVAVGVAVLAVTTLAGCFGAPVTATPSAEPDVATPFDGSGWMSEGTEATQGCDEAVVLLTGGTLSHAIRCPDDPAWISTNGHDDDSSWSLLDDRITLSYRGGEKVCEGPATLESLDLTCTEQGSDSYPRVFLPSP